MSDQICHQIPSHTHYVNNSCPACGYCPHCGRGGYRFIPWNPYGPPYYPYPYKPYYPTWTNGTGTGDFTQFTPNITQTLDSSGEGK